MMEFLFRFRGAGANNTQLSTARKATRHRAMITPETAWWERGIGRRRPNIGRPASFRWVHVLVRCVVLYSVGESDAADQISDDPQASGGYMYWLDALSLQCRGIGRRRPNIGRPTSFRWVHVLVRCVVMCGYSALYSVGEFGRRRPNIGRYTSVKWLHILVRCFMWLLRCIQCRESNAVYLVSVWFCIRVMV